MSTAPPLDPFDTPPTGPVEHVYVHAPFCARRCFYCDFAVHVSRTADVGGWIGAVSAERALLEEEGRFPFGETLKTLYVGGGTPSLLGPSAMRRLADLLGRDRLAGPLEWTAEANPESFTEEVARGWVAAGVNRLSLGVQSFDDRVLRWMGRLHGREGGAAAVRRARAAGLEAINVDLIFGLPDEVPRSWRDDLEGALALDVPHVSLYGLSVEAGTPLHEAVRGGSLRPAAPERYEDEYLLASERLVSEGYTHYEVSNFARPGAESRHNAAYWSSVPYVGLGNGAHSYQHPLRRWNLRSWPGYEEAATSGRLPLADSEVLEPDATALERVWLGLRTMRGLVAGVARPEGRVADWTKRGLAVTDGDRLRLTPAGWMLLDGLAVDLAEDLELGTRRVPALPGPRAGGLD